MNQGKGNETCLVIMATIKLLEFVGIPSNKKKKEGKKKETFKNDSM